MAAPAVTVAAAMAAPAVTAAQQQAAAVAPGPAGYVLLLLKGRDGALVVCAEDTHSRVFLKAAGPRVAGVNGAKSLQAPAFMLPTFQPHQAVPLDTCPL